MDKKKILVISSNYTGAGHISIYNSLQEQFAKESAIELNWVEGFHLNGKVSTALGKTYGFMTRRAKILWYLVWFIAEYTPITEFVTRQTMHRRFIKLIASYQPHLILSLHPNYNAPILDLLNKHNLSIPHITVISDIVTISKLWVDKRATLIFCGTNECKTACIKKGVSPSILRLSGFPVRDVFFANIKRLSIQEKKTIELLIVSGAEGVGNFSELISELLMVYRQVRITVITGRNLRMRETLERLFLKESHRVTILGFVQEIHTLMAETDILITRGSPNTLFEAVAMNIPIIAFGMSLPQEKGNIQFIMNHELGVTCKKEKEVTKKVGELLDNQFKLYKHIQENQKKYVQYNAAEKIVHEIIQLVNKIEDLDKDERHQHEDITSINKKDY